MDSIVPGKPHSQFTVNSGRILIVDDSKPWRLNTKQLLEADGYTVFTAEDGQEGLAQIAKEELDLVLLDVVLPDMNGFDICSKIRANPRTQAMPVLMFSGVQIDSEIKAQGLETGADEYIIKPIGNRELLARIQARLRLQDAHNEIDTQKRWLATALDSISDAVLTLDPKGTILTANQIALKMLGQDQDEVEGSLVAVSLRLKNDQDRPIFLSSRQLHQQAEIHTLPDCWLTTHRGQSIPVRVRISPMRRGDAQTHVGTVITIQDIQDELMARRQQNLIGQLADKMNRVENYDQALEAALGLICYSYGWAYGEAWVPVSPDQNRDQSERQSEGQSEDRHEDRK